MLPEEERLALLKPILDRPEDHLTRLILADWLQEHEEHVHSDWLRLTVRLREIAVTCPLDCPPRDPAERGEAIRSCPLPPELLSSLLVQFCRIDRYRTLFDILPTVGLRHAVVMAELSPLFGPQEMDHALRPAWFSGYSEIRQQAVYSVSSILSGRPGTIGATLESLARMVWMLEVEHTLGILETIGQVNGRMVQLCMLFAKVVGESRE